MFHSCKFDEELAQAADYGVAVSDDSGVAESGIFGVSLVGTGGVAKAGVGGILIFLDDSGVSRVACVAYVGQDGIEPDQFYEFDGESVVISSYGS